MICKQLTPPGGWQFKQSDTLVLKGESWEDLVRHVAVYRLSNRLPVGNPAKEIEEQLERLHPSIVIGK